MEMSDEGSVSATKKINLKDIGFHFAWAFEGAWNKGLKDDPRYVK